MTRWIETCLSTVKLSFMINGQSHGFLQARRGRRHGDPVSPLLFVLGMQYFSRLLLDLEHDPNFHFHAKCKRMKLTHLIFVDGFMAICRADKTSPLILKKKIEEFAAVSGLIVNNSKSHMFLSHEA